MSVVSVSMPAELIERLDAVVEEYDYSGRSEIVRESARSRLEEFEDDRLADRRLVGVVSALYEFGAQSVERRVADVRHDHEDVVASTDHSHVGTTGCCESASEFDGGATRSCSGDAQPTYCFDVFVLEGDLEDVSTFVGKLRAIDGVETVDYSLVALDAVGRLRASGN